MSWRRTQEQRSRRIEVAARAIPRFASLAHRRSALTAHLPSLESDVTLTLIGRAYYLKQPADDTDCVSVLPVHVSCVYRPSTELAAVHAKLSP